MKLRHQAVSALVISEICFFREGIVAALEDAPEIGPVTEAARAPEPERDVAAPDVVIVDLATTQSLSVIAAVRRAVPDACIVALGADREEQALACARASVRGFVTRDQSLDELVSTVVEVGRGRELCPPSVGVLLLRVMGGNAASDRGRGDALTDRELDVVKLLERGLSNKEIAAALVIEPATVKNHVHNVLRKLNVHRRGQVAALGRRRSRSAEPFGLWPGPDGPVLDVCRRQPVRSIDVAVGVGNNRLVSFPGPNRRRQAHGDATRSRRRDASHGARHHDPGATEPRIRGSRRAPRSNGGAPGGNGHPPILIVAAHGERLGPYEQDLLAAMPDAVIVAFDETGRSIAKYELWPRRSTLGELSVEAIAAAVSTASSWDERFRD